MVRHRNKYGNIKTVVDGFKFDSKKEAARYVVLRELESLGTITDLRRQVGFPIIINGKKVATWYADFVYSTVEGKEIVEDVKSPATLKSPIYRLKKKIVEALYTIQIYENL